MMELSHNATANWLSGSPSLTVVVFWLHCSTSLLWRAGDCSFGPGQVQNPPVQHGVSGAVTSPVSQQLSFPRVHFTWLLSLFTGGNRHACVTAAAAVLLLLRCHHLLTLASSAQQHRVCILRCMSRVLQRTQPFEGHIHLLSSQMGQSDLYCISWLRHCHTSPQP